MSTVLTSLDDISEQRLKPADTALSRHLKKHPRSQPALVLRAVVLEKLGYPAEDVLRVYKEARATGEFSPRSIFWAGLALRGVGRREVSHASSRTKLIHP
jgi:N-terminal acetyltransferase B complex non-catalytic subunit